MKLSARPNSAVLTQRQTLWITGAAAAVLLPLSAGLPPWLLSMAALALAWRSWLLWRKISLPPGWLINLAALLGSFGVAIHFHTLLGKDSGVALLALLLSLKLFEMRSARDAFFALLLCYFLILSTYFYTQSIATASAMVLTVLVVTAALANLHREHAPLKALRLAGVMLLQALPFMVLLFVLFPRISSPLWGLPADAGTASSGLSDSMAPGSISQLSLSDAISFRVKFAGEMPERDALYWRGPVMTRFDGRTWQMAQPRISARQSMPIAGRDAIDYEVTLEPQQRHWLFAIEYPTRLAPDSVIAQDHQMFSRKPVRNRLRYAMTSDPTLAAGLDESPDVLRQALELPQGYNPKALALAAQMRSQYPRDPELILRILAMYRKQPFTYTLSPPLLGRDSIDEFLFSTRRGFCEHFAASFVFLARAAGIPARIVTGYQGGEVNPVDDYLVVRQSDAHAWAEVWLQGQGWIRVDPTAVIAPERVSTNIAAAVPAGDPLPLLSRPELSWLRALRFRSDAIANAWNQWVLGYDTQHQQELLRRLGMSSPDWQSMTATLVALCGTLMLLLTLWTLRQWQRSDPLAALWERFSRKLAKLRLQRHAWEGPRDYARRIAVARPALGAQAAAICQLYERLRYGGAPPRDGLAELKQRIGSLKI